jgi:hypothetical protein
MHRTIHHREHVTRHRTCLVHARDGEERTCIFFASAPFLTQEEDGYVNVAGIDCARVGHPTAMGREPAPPSAAGTARRRRAGRSSLREVELVR